MQKVTVKKDCTYNDKLLKAGTTVYISEAYNFGKQKIFNEAGDLLSFCEIEWNDFEWSPVFVSPSEDKTAEPELRAKIKETLERVYLRKFPTTKEEKDLEYATDILIPVVEEYATLCRNKAIEEAVQCVFKNGFTDNENQTEFLISELNKMKV